MDEARCRGRSPHAHARHFGFSEYSDLDGGPGDDVHMNHTLAKCKTNPLRSPHRWDRSVDKVLGSDYNLRVLMTAHSKVTFSNVSSGNLFLVR